jgi:uncharacterized membrane protein
MHPVFLRRCLRDVPDRSLLHHDTGGMAQGSATMTTIIQVIESILIIIFFVLVLAGILTMVTRKTEEQDSPEVQAFESMAKWYYYLTRRDHE